MVGWLKDKTGLFEEARQGYSSVQSAKVMLGKTFLAIGIEGVRSSSAEQKGAFMRRYSQWLHDDCRQAEVGT